MGEVDEYFGRLEPDTRAAFERVRRIVVELVPGAAQGMSYGVPALMYEGKPLIGFHAGKKHLSVYPYSGAVVPALSERLPGLEASGGTVRFAVGTPLPADAVRALVRLRIAEIEHAS